MRRRAERSTLSLPFPARELSPEAGLSEPRLWICRLCVWHDFDAAPVRDIEFRRGLNIIVSPGGATAASTSTGHAAGKTLFCRQVRFCLGEDSFADQEDTSVIRARFPRGGVAAHLRLRGEPWVVRRGYGTRSDHRAKRSARIQELWDDAHRDTFDLFRAALRSSVFDDAQQRLLRSFGEVADPWQYVLAWLTRDQECRLDGLTHWRHPESDSHSAVQSVGADTRLDVLRVVLGLYADEAPGLRERTAEAASAVSKAASSASRHQERMRVLRTELANGLAIPEDKIWPPAPVVLQDEERARAAHFQRLREFVDDRIRAVAAVEMSEAQRGDEEALENAKADLAEVEERTKNATQELETRSAHLDLLAKENSEAWAALRRANHPTCPFDDTPLDVERARFVCPLPRLPDKTVAQQLADDTEARRQELADAVASQRESITRLKRSRAGLAARVTRLERSIAAHEQARADSDAARQAAWATKATLSRFIEVVNDLEAARMNDDRAKAAQKRVAEQKKRHLESYSTAHLTAWFDQLVKRVVAAEARGDVTLDGNGLHATIQWRGRRRSVALNSLRLVLFDIAAMLCAVEGASSAPAFLVHDSPREGDLDPWTYARLFETVFGLGREEDTASFQYIVTTTTEPPDGEIRQRVRDVFSAKSDTERFFRVDL